MSNLGLLANPAALDSVKAKEDREWSALTQIQMPTPQQSRLQRGRTKPLERTSKIMPTNHTVMAHSKQQQTQYSNQWMKTFKPRPS